MTDTKEYYVVVQHEHAWRYLVVAWRDSYKKLKKAVETGAREEYKTLPFYKKIITKNAYVKRKLRALESNNGNGDIQQYIHYKDVSHYSALCDMFYPYMHEFLEDKTPLVITKNEWNYIIDVCYNSDREFWDLFINR